MLGVKMENLKEQYEAIENGFNWSKKASPIVKSNQFYRIAKSLRLKVRERSLNKNLIPNEYKERLYILSEFLDNFCISFIPIDYDSELNDKNENKKLLWYHRSSRQIQGLDGQKTEVTDKDLLLTTAATYLAHPWLQLNVIDWIFLDSLIFSELSGYREAIFSGEVLGKINWNHVFADRKKFLDCIDKTVNLFCVAIYYSSCRYC